VNVRIVLWTKIAEKLSVKRIRVTARFEFGAFGLVNAGQRRQIGLGGTPEED
jgi:hypothetical protein